MAPSRGKRRKGWAAIGVLAVVTMTTAPVSAQDSEYDLPAALVEFWASESGQELIAEYTIPPSSVTDPLDDFEFSSGDAPGLAPTGNLDIVEARTFSIPPLAFPQPFFQSEDNGGIFCESDASNPVIPGVTTICPETGVDLAAFADGAVVTVIDTAEPHGFFDLSKTCEWVVWYQQPDRPLFQPLDQFPLDPARDTNQAIGLRAGPNEFGPFRLDLTDDGFFQPMPTNTLIARGENQIAFFTPASEIGTPLGARAYTFCTEGSYQPSDSVADSTSFFDVLIEVDQGLVLVPATVPTTTTQPPAPTTTVAAAAAPTTTTVAAAIVGTEAPAEEPASSSSNSWIPILIGAVMIAVGAILYGRTRERRRPGSGAPIGSTPAPQDPTHQCDWAMYVSDGGVRTVVRPAGAQECCVYDLEIKTTVDFHDEAARGRQDAESPHGAEASPDDRLRIPDLGWGAGGPYVWGWSSARSGPAGRQDWMQGLGDPRTNAGRSTDHSPAAQLTQQRTLEEGPEVAAHLTHLESTVVSATLDANCPDHENTFSVKGESTVFVQASHECTNAAPGPECPIEFTAAGWVEARLVGDLTYSTEQLAGSDVDELEPLAERVRKQMELAGPIAMTDSHDHATRARDTFEDSKRGKGNNVVTGDDLGFTILSGVQVDAGTIVPVATWPNTERVTADIYGDVAHDVDVNAAMERHDCEATACNGHGDCLCEPKFDLQIATNTAKLTVDGETFNLTRPMPDGTWKLA